MGAARRAVELMPFVPEYWSALARMLEAAGGKEREALDAWNRVVTLADRDPSQRKAVQAALDHIQRIKAQLRN
jgi:hypothetical protein